MPRRETNPNRSHYMASTTLSDSTIKEIISCYVRAYTMREASRELKLSVKTIRNYYHLITRRMFEVLNFQTSDMRQTFEGNMREALRIYVKADPDATAFYSHEVLFEELKFYAESNLRKHRGFPNNEISYVFFHKYYFLLEELVFNGLVIGTHARHLSDKECRDIATDQLSHDFCEMLKRSGPLNLVPDENNLELAIEFLDARRSNRIHKSTPAIRRGIKRTSQSELIRQTIERIRSQQNS